MSHPVVDALADALAGLDVAEDDELLIRALAAALVDLDLDEDDVAEPPGQAAADEGIAKDQ